MDTEQNTTLVDTRKGEAKCGNVTSVKTLEGLDEGLSLFSPALLETGIKSEYVIEHSSLSSPGRRKAVDFHITTANPFYIDMSKTLLKFKVSIKRSDHTDLDPDKDVVAFVQAPLYSVWRQCDILIQNKLISSGVSINYPYKAVLDHLVYKNADYINSTAQCGLFYYDTAFYIDKVSASSSGVNMGFYRRLGYCKNGKAVTLEGPLAHDLTDLSCFIPPGLDIKIRLFPSEDAFALHYDPSESSESYYFEVSDISLKVRAVEATNDIIGKHKTLMSNRQAVMKYPRSVIKTFTIPQNLNQWSVSQLWSGELPYECLVSFVSSQQYLGSAEGSPFNFQTFGINYLNLFLDNYQDITFTPDFALSSDWVSEYRALFERDSGEQSHSSIISLSDFPGGYSIYRFRLAPEGAERKNRSHYGVGRLTMRFSQSLTQPVTLIIYSRFHDRIRVDKTNNIWLSEC